MKYIIRLSVFLSVLLLGVNVPALNASGELPFANPRQPISLDFKNAQLKDVLKIFSVQSGLNFIASEAVKDRIMTLYFDKVPVEAALDKLFEANNLIYVLDPESNIFIVKDLGKPEVDLVTKVFNLKYASVSSSHILEEVKANLGTCGSSTTVKTDNNQQGDRYGVASDLGITTAVRRLLSVYGSVIEDYRTNSLIVQDIPIRLPNIEQAIATLDVSTPQILVEVEILDVNKQNVDKIGFKFGQSPLTLNTVMVGSALTGPGALGGFAGKSIASLAKSAIGFNRDPLDSTSSAYQSSYQVVLDFLRTQSDTKFLARPRIVTLNNEIAEFKITTQETVNVVSTMTTADGQTATTSNQAERIETGITLRVTPQVNLATGEITMFIMPTVKDTQNSAFTTATGNIKDAEERTTKSLVRIKDGETVILGGLIRKQRSQTITKLPVLGDVPLIGGLFRHKNMDKDQDRELLVFITPHIVKEKPVSKFAKVSDVGLSTTKVPVREQDAVPVPDRRAVLNSSLNRYEEKK